MNATTLPRESAIAVFRPSRARLEQLGEWFAAEYEPLLRFAYFVSGNRSVAEDLVQEAFVRISGAARALEREGFPAYARRTILNLSRSAYRHRQVERRFLRAAPPPPVAADPSERGGDDALWKAILTLSPKQRACVTLRFYEDRSEEETARMLGMSEGTVKQHVHRAMAKLRQALGESRE